MANVKIVLQNEVRKDGQRPLAIRIIKNRKPVYIYLEYRIFAKDWNKGKCRVKRSHPNAVRLNNYISKNLAETIEKTVELESTQKNVTASMIRQHIKPTSNGGVYAQADLYLIRLKETGKFNQYSANKPRVNRFKDYLKFDTSFSELTISFLKNYKAWLKQKYKMSERTAINYLVVVRSIFSQAIAEGACDEKHYPFGRGKYQLVFPESIKIGLSQDEVNLLETLLLTGKAHHARNLFLFSYYFAGMRVSDVLRMKWSDLQDDRLHYIMGKNKKSGSLKIPKKALAIISEYKSMKDETDLLFPALRKTNLKDSYLIQRNISTHTNMIDKVLRTEVAPSAGITKKLTMHIARHTFGNLSGDKIPLQMLQRLYRHSTITTTVNYQQNFIHTDTDNALEAVIGV